MLIIQTALDIEASFLIETLDLKRNHRIFTHKVFENSDFRLICSGVGKIKAAVATTKLLAQSEDSRLLQKPQLLNLGFAAGLDKNISDLFLINKIHDAQLANNFYPELYLKSSIPEASLITVDHAANDKNSYSGFDLIDMEASAIFTAALIFVPLDHLHFLKIVSDNCSDKFLDKHRAKDLFAKNKDHILEYFNNLKIHQALQPKLLSWEEFQKIKLLAENAYLSHTQFAQLEQALEHFLYKRGDLNKFFKLFSKTIANKNEGKAYLNDLINFCKCEDVQ